MIVSIPDLCTLTYFSTKEPSSVVNKETFIAFVVTGLTRSVSLENLFERVWMDNSITKKTTT